MIYHNFITHIKRPTELKKQNHHIFNTDFW